MRTENLLNLKIHKLSQEQYDKTVAEDKIDPTALYLTPDDGYVTAGQKEGTELGERVTAEGFETTASADYAHAEGFGTIANSEAQHVQGKFNIENSDYAHIVGNGTSDEDRSNAHTLDWNGNAWYAGDLIIGGTDNVYIPLETLAVGDYVSQITLSSEQLEILTGCQFEYRDYRVIDPNFRIDFEDGSFLGADSSSGLYYQDAGGEKTDVIDSWISGDITLINQHIQSICLNTSSEIVELGNDSVGEYLRLLFSDLIFTSIDYKGNITVVGGTLTLGNTKITTDRLNNLYSNSKKLATELYIQQQVKKHEDFWHLQNGIEFRVSDEAASVVGYIDSPVNRNLIIPNTYNGLPVTVISSKAFSGCKNLESIIIPDSVFGIDTSAFYDCENLKNVVIPDSVSVIMPGAFERCSSLESLTIPFVGRYSSHNLTSEGLFGYIFGPFSPNDPTASIPASLKSVTITGGKSIAASAFSGCHNLKSITILGNTLKSIGSDAFSYCESLTSVIIPDSVTSIGDYAFCGCDSLASVTIGNSVTSIGNNAFSACSALTSVTIPNSVTSIGEWAFYDCLALTSVTIPNSVTSIGDSAFDGCPIKNAVVPTSAISYIPKVNLETIEINGGTSIESYAFYGYDSLTSVIIPNSVESIGYEAFCGCDSLTSVTIPDSVTSIDKQAFSNCSSLTSVTIPDSVTSIGDEAFSHCTALTSVTIPNSVTSIGKGAFLWCKSLTSVTIPDSVTSIGEQAFAGCSSLECITLPFVGGSKSATSASKSTVFGYIFGNVWYSGGTEVVQYYSSSSKTTNYIPSSLKSVTVTDGNILYGAFAGCVMLENIILPRKLTAIETSAFNNCYNLKSLIIPSSVTKIGSSAFVRCYSLSTLAIPNSVTTMDSYAFDINPMLTIYCEKEEQPESWNSGWYGNNDAFAHLIWGCFPTGQSSDNLLATVIDLTTKLAEIAARLEVLEQKQ